MNSYTVTHTCGHTKTYYRLFADNRGDAAEANAANTDCQECREMSEAWAVADDPIRNIEQFDTPAPRGLFKAS